jgi:hypothetical protein
MWGLLNGWLMGGVVATVAILHGDGGEVDLG